MSDSELGGLFGETEEKMAVHPAEKIVKYTRPSGDTLNVCVVGHHVLWANYLWNGAHWMSDYICTHPDEFCGKTILELGAGAGLPSILAAEAGAHHVVVTDYPDNELVVNIQKNIDSLLDEEAQKRITAKGYLWGADATSVLINNTKFDIIIMCDVIFNHSEHYKLLQTIRNCQSPTGIVWCVFSHYRPWYQDRDLALLQLVRDELQMETILVDTHKYDELVVANSRGDADLMKTVFAYRFKYTY